MGWVVNQVTASRFLFLALAPIALLLVSGVSFSESITTEPFAKSIRNDRPSGGFRGFLEIRGSERVLKIVEVTPDGPADRAGLKVGDLIVALDGSPLPGWKNDLERVKDLDRLYTAGDVVAVAFARSPSSSPGDAGQALREAELEMGVMPVEVQEDLIRWVAIAEQRLSEGEPLYCHDVRPSKSDTHHVCHDDSDDTKQP